MPRLLKGARDESCRLTRASALRWQDTLEDALAALNRGDPVRVTPAGRTDKGVHASGQVVNFTLPWWRHGPDSMMRALNSKLPRDVSIVQSQLADAHFHARYSASYRRYCYLIYNAPQRSPLFLRHAWHVKEMLDVQRMQDAAKVLVGTHDFSTFGSPPDGSSHCIREIISIDVRKTAAPAAGIGPFSPSSPCGNAAVAAISSSVPPALHHAGGTSADCRVIDPDRWAAEASVISIDIVGRSFLYRMVRNIVGSLKAVGRGKDDIRGLRLRLQKRSRQACGIPAPAHGLTLTQVGFWGEDGGLTFDEWAASRPASDVFGQRLALGPPAPDTLPVRARAE